MPHDPTLRVAKHSGVAGGVPCGVDGCKACCDGGGRGICSALRSVVVHGTPQPHAAAAAAASIAAASSLLLSLR